MTVLSILGCKILQDELVWLLSNDPNIDNILIVENKNIFEFTRKLDEQYIPYEILPLDKISNKLEETDENKVTIVVNFLEVALHMLLNKLKSEVYQNMREMITFSSGILVLYGLCGNVLGDVEKDFSMESDGCVVRILKDNSGRIVDDCIAASVGGCANYFKLITENTKEPAFFLTPMFAASWKEFPLTGYDFDSNPEEALRLTKMILGLAGYSRVAKVNTGLTYVKDFDERVEEYAKLFGYSMFEISGSQEIFENCYQSIKNELNIR
ncbi:hypothetical protein Mpsy_0572 [Methanolobus psychrophilus R15]|nr:hypothetical protein Mpsy_0572 [Methanolobus psychrophilus R15]